MNVLYINAAVTGKMQICSTTETKIFWHLHVEDSVAETAKIFIFILITYYN